MLMRLILLVIFGILTVLPCVAESSETDKLINLLNQESLPHVLNKMDGAGNYDEFKSRILVIRPELKPQIKQFESEKVSKFVRAISKCQMDSSLSEDERTHYRLLFLLNLSKRQERSGDYKNACLTLASWAQQNGMAADPSVNAELDGIKAKWRAALQAELQSSSEQSSGRTSPKNSLEAQPTPAKPIMTAEAQSSEDAEATGLNGGGVLGLSLTEDASGKVVVNSVNPRSSFYEKVQPGDQLVTVDGGRVTDISIARYLGSGPIGLPIKIVVLRQGRAIIVQGTRIDSRLIRP